jgi:teichoic acid transport system permease protein
MTDVRRDDGLVDLGANESFRSYVAEIWARRDFLRVVPRNDIRIRNMDTVLGQFWLVLNPALMVGVYYVIFGVLLNTRRGTDNFFVFLVIGVLLFRFSQRVITESVSTMNRNIGLIRVVQFPRVMLPLTTVIGQTIAFLPSVLILAATLVVSGQYPTWRWLLFPFVILAQLLIQTGAAFIGARLGYSVRDLSQLLPHVFRLLLYASGVLFSIENFVNNARIERLLAVNPFFDILNTARWTLIGQPATSDQLIGLVLWAALLPIAGFWFFRRAESEYGA